MAITIEDQPYKWAIRGQKLMIIAISDEISNSGFRYGVDVTIEGKLYSFYVSAAPDDRLYFDLSPLVDDMRNVLGTNSHYATDDTVDDNSKLDMSFTLSENWIVDGVLTVNPGSAVVGEEMIAINGYFQVIDGYKPNVLTGSAKVQRSLTSSTTSLPMSDRFGGMHVNKYQNSWGFGSTNNLIWIPVFESDYGLLSIPGNDTYLTNNVVDTYRISMFPATGSPVVETLSLNGYDIEGLPVYPANLNDFTTLTVKPSLFANWRCYTVAVFNGINQRSKSFIFYNAGVYGQRDCNYYNMRLAFVNSKGGWDYFNFIKKSETTDEIERKKFRRVLFNGTTAVFEATDRGLQERRNLVQQVITITSDFISEGEFQFLRSLLVSNQVEWLTQDADKNIAIPVNLDDTSYVEKNTRDGKLYNVTLKMRIANEYWT
jgi:hypothetical protein